MLQDCLDELEVLKSIHDEFNFTTDDGSIKLSFDVSSWNGAPLKLELCVQACDTYPCTSPTVIIDNSSVFSQEFCTIIGKLIDASVAAFSGTDFFFNLVDSIINEIENFDPTHQCSSQTSHSKQVAVEDDDEDEVEVDDLNLTTPQLNEMVAEEERVSYDEFVEWAENYAKTAIETGMWPYKSTASDKLTGRHIFIQAK